MGGYFIPSLHFPRGGALKYYHEISIGAQKNKKKRKKKFVDNTPAFTGAFSGLLTTRPTGPLLKIEY